MQQVGKGNSARLFARDCWNDQLKKELKRGSGCRFTLDVFLYIEKYLTNNLLWSTIRFVILELYSRQPS